MQTHVVGQKFNSLTVVAQKGLRGGTVVCLCDCGTTKEYRRCFVVSGHYKTCGCGYRKQQAVIANYLLRHGDAKHGANTPTYRTWQAMWTRCTNQNQLQWENYGGRGIKIHPSWKTYENFLADMGERPEHHSLDRIDNDGDYSPTNCRWATRTEQRRNSSQVTPITLDGVTKFSWEWSELLGVPARTIYNRSRQQKKGSPDRVGHLPRPASTDKVGKVYGGLVVIAQVGKKCLCRCVCGKEVSYFSSILKSHVSCGCTPTNRKHGKASNGKQSKAYSAWAGMKSRCYNSRTRLYKNIGGKGISMCDTWLNFLGFLADMGEPPKDSRLCRKDITKNYDKENCYWGDRKGNVIV